MALDFAGFQSAALKQYPNNAKQINEFVARKQREELARQGALDVGDIAKTDPGSALRLIQEGIKPKVEESAEERKQKQKLSDLSSSLDVLEQNFKQVEAQGPILGRGAGLISKLTSGAAFGEIADYDSLRKGMIGPVARAISGEVGVLTDRDIARAENLLPKVSDDPKLAQRKLNNLRDLISRKGGTGPIEGIEGVSTKKSGAGPLIGGLLGGGIGGFLGPGGAIAGAGVGTGAGMAVEESLQDLLGTQEESKKQLTKRVVTEPLIASLLTAGGIGIGKLAGVARHPFRYVGEKRAAAVADAAGKTVSGDKIVSALEKGLGDVSPTAEQGYKKFLEIAKGKYTGKQLTLDQTLRLNSAANDAYTAAGKVGKASTAKFNKILGDVLKRELKITAPKVAEANKLFEFLYKTQGITKKVGPPALVSGAAGAVGYNLIRKLQGL